MTTSRAQNALRKVAFDWGKAGKHAAYGVGGAGVGLAANALLGNKSLLSYILSGGLGAGAGLGTEALVDYIRRKRGEGSSSSDSKEKETKKVPAQTAASNKQVSNQPPKQALKKATPSKAAPKKEEKKATPEQMQEAAARMYGPYSPTVLANGGSLPKSPLEQLIENSRGSSGPVLRQGTIEGGGDAGDDAASNFSWAPGPGTGTGILAGLTTSAVGVPTWAKLWFDKADAWDARVRDINKKHSIERTVRNEQWEKEHKARKAIDDAHRLIYNDAQIDPKARRRQAANMSGADLLENWQKVKANRVQFGDLADTLAHTEPRAPGKQKYVNPNKKVPKRVADKYSDKKFIKKGITLSILPTLLGGTLGYGYDLLNNYLGNSRNTELQNRIMSGAR